MAGISLTRFRRCGHWLCGLMLGLGWLASVQAKIQVLDDRGNNLSLQQPAQRVLALAPHAVEILFAVGAGDRLLARPLAATYPEQAARLPSLGDGVRLDPEVLLSYKPDLIIAWDTAGPRTALSPLIRMGIPVYWSDPQSLSQIARNMRNLARLTGQDSQGEAVATEFERSIAAWRLAYANKTPRPKALYVIWSNPWMTVNGQHFISELLALCSADNLFADLPPLAGRLAFEAILQRQPQMILAASAADLNKFSTFPQLPASRYQGLLQVNPDWFERPGPRVIQALGSLCPEVERVRRQMQ